MAKKKERDWTTEIVRAIQKAVSGIPGQSDLPEAVYLENFGNALDICLHGVEMRQEELGDEEAE